MYRSKSESQTCFNRSCSQKCDQIEVLTSDKQTPKEEWLQNAVTAKAKSQIKMAVKKERRKAVERGKDVVFRMFGQVKLITEEDVLLEFAILVLNL